LGDMHNYLKYIIQSLIIFKPCVIDEKHCGE